MSENQFQECILLLLNKILKTLCRNDESCPGSYSIDKFQCQYLCEYKERYKLECQNED